MILRKGGNRKMDDNKELDQLFNFNEEDLVKVAKRKSISKMISVSIGVSLLIIILLGALKIQIVPIILDKEASEVHYYYDTHGANIVVGGFSGTTRLNNNSIYAKKYKVINNVPVTIGEVEIPNVKYENNYYMSDGNVFSDAGHRVMQFFHPRINYTTYKKDLNELNKLESNDVVELGISFDRRYSFDEVREMLPDNIQLNWCWVDTIDDNFFNIDEEFFNSEYAVFYEEDIMGFPTINGNGKLKEDPMAEFIESFDLILAKTRKQKEELTNAFNKLAGGAGTINPEEVPIIGVVVVGTVEELKALDNISSIKASSFGVILK